MLTRPRFAGVAVLQREGVMPKRLMVECECDRCNRKWYEDPEDPTKPKKTEKKNSSLVLAFEDGTGTPVEKTYETLCPKCTNAVAGYVRSILKEKSDDGEQEEATEDGAKGEGGTAAPSPPAKPPSAATPPRSSSSPRAADPKGTRGT